MSRTCMLVMILTTSHLMGCASVLHELKPHRLHRLNRHPAPSQDPEFTSRTPSQSLTILRAQSPE